MPPLLRFRKLSFSEDTVNPTAKQQTTTEKPKRRRAGRCSCVDSCCWAIGYLCTAWWLLLFLYHSVPVPAMLQARESPGTRLSRDGVKALHPMILVPGIVTGGLELWEGRPCAEGLFRKRLWGASFTEILRRPLCWLEHLSLDSETGLDPPGIRVRAVPGLVAADYFVPCYFAWAVLIENLAKIGYEGKNLHMASYDWRLSFHNTEVRDQSLSRLKSKIELMYATNGYKKVVVVPHSMGAIYFLHFLKWVETPLPDGGGGGGPGWCAKHVKAIVNIGPAFLGVPKAVSNLLSAEGKDIAYARSLAPGLLDSELLKLQTLEHLMRMSHSWDSIFSLLPKGGEAIWGNLDSHTKEGHSCIDSKRKLSQSNLHRQNDGIRPESWVKEPAKYGRIIAFGKRASEVPSSQLNTLNTKELSRGDDSLNDSTSCGEFWSEYSEISRESIVKVAENTAYTATTVLDLLRFIAPKMMKRAEAHFSHGIAEDLDDPKYGHYKYWSNPLETKLPDALEMEMYCLYGVGIPTERSYIYKLTTPSSKCKSSIPFRIDGSVDGDDDIYLKGGTRFVDGDESVPVISAGFMCAKGWRGKTRFNPSGMETFVREYKHKPPGSLLESRGTESGSHVDIMGNVGLIEDVLRIASGASGQEIGGDRVYSNVMKMSERVSIKL
ncbi:PREDICTED: putative phospholipid:diacylglycerol acyltransferase 2 [Camelina sativa]|uniref:Phospholipid:diacylglycerol acyltransferase 2 n=1 Tax=Camelina sativa TaxID=90675 RepID=A0ABM0YM84_CAMSA|nr:PREDICTED: putative phospholipid:diacylglycerol acyltransferase 2 [Camelina sativa]